jgi:hypothetical protein
MIRLPATRERRRPLSDSFKDVLGLVIGTVLLMLVWVAIEGGPYRLSPGTKMDSRSVSSQPVSAIGAVTGGLER